MNIVVLSQGLKFVQDSRIGIVPAVLSLLSLDDSSCTFDVFGLILQNNSKFGQQ